MNILLVFKQNAKATSHKRWLITVQLLMKLIIHFVTHCQHKNTFGTCAGPAYYIACCKNSICMYCSAEGLQTTVRVPFAALRPFWLAPVMYMDFLLATLGDKANAKNTCVISSLNFHESHMTWVATNFLLPVPLVDLDNSVKASQGNCKFSNSAYINW